MKRRQPFPSPEKGKDEMKTKETAQNHANWRRRRRPKPPSGREGAQK
jgi:hypothetical protein